MQVYFERSGGFMGLRLQTTVDTADLSAKEAEEWEQTLTAAGFFSLPSSLATESGVDSFVYKLTVVTAEREHTAFCTDEDAPEELRPLLRRLTVMAR